MKVICWLLSNFAACGEEFVQCLSEYSIRLCALMKHESKSVQVEALWALGNMICVANDVQKSSLLTREVISSLVEAIPNSDEVEGKLLLTVFMRIIDRPEVADYRH